MTAPHSSAKNHYPIKFSWVTSELGESIEKKNNINNFSKQNIILKIKECKCLRSRKLRSAKCDFYDESLTVNKENLSKYWSVIKDLLCTKSKYPNNFTDDNKIIRDENKISENLNNFFVSVRPSFAN